ncbi:hypothetical protein Nepgr_029434 [Nepenthes gracilis]|uniref:Uncharacterized protein n=1 Tax=Nepenthes gracilis TaxID=150966 RepID=A0AAD3TEX4_NEPGR|nr:hypothetical protein Nepgr_029434 [Nepenthes gracilis]
MAVNMCPFYELSVTEYSPNATLSTAAASSPQLRRRQLTSLAATILSHGLLSAVAPALAESDKEYVKDTKEAIDKVRTTINMDKNDPNTAAAVAGLRKASNSWAAPYRREKALLGRVSFRDIYSALIAVSDHYISF